MVDCFEYEERVMKNAPFSYRPYKILEYIEGDNYDYVRYEVEKVNVFGSFQDVKRNTELNQKEINILSNAMNNQFKDHKERININRETLKNLVEISTDVRPNNGYDNHSWATISIGGKVQYVQFIDLNRRNMMEIIQFLKKFEAGRHVVDTPYRQIFEDKLYYFRTDNE